MIEPEESKSRVRWFQFDLRLMFAHFQQHGLQGSPEAVARLTQVLGHPPRSFEAFATETAAQWQASVSARRPDDGLTQ